MPRNADTPDLVVPRTAPSLRRVTGCCVISLMRFSIATLPGSVANCLPAPFICARLSRCAPAASARPGVRVASRLARGDCDGVPQLTGLPCRPATYSAGVSTVARARLSVRLTGLLAGAIVAACAALISPAANAAPSSGGPASVGAWSAAVENAATGRLLWSRNLNTERPMASITKVMTALVVIRAGDLNREITIPSAVVEYVREWDASNAGLRPGDKLTAGQLLYAMLLPSGADAAYALAAAYGPGLNAFIAKMNAVARLIGMTRTHFSTFDGLPYPTPYSNYSTAANLLTLGRVAMRSPLFRSIVDQRSYRVAAG